MLDDGRPTASRIRGGVVTTKAQAEGGIEGSAKDYRMLGPFGNGPAETSFSRFHECPWATKFACYPMSYQGLYLIS